jgi:DNA-binding NtrC family response regulator
MAIGRRRRSVVEGQKATRTILLVEDNEQLRALYGMILADAGFRIVSAQDASQALAHEGPIDALVTDLSLPGMNGHELATRIRDRRPGVPVLFTSGWAGTSVPEESVPGAAFLGKPFQRRDLLEAIETLLGSRAHA